MYQTGTGSTALPGYQDAHLKKRAAQHQPLPPWRAQSTAVSALYPCRPCARRQLPPPWRRGGAAAAAAAELSRDVAAAAAAARGQQRRGTTKSILSGLLESKMSKFFHSFPPGAAVKAQPGGRGALARATTKCGPPGHGVNFSVAPGHGVNFSVAPGHGVNFSVAPGHGVNFSVAPGHGVNFSVASRL
eukprot:351075-Chlamydomonas_euryale.AAC.4